MKRWLRMGLAALLVIGLFMTVRQQVSLRRSERDNLRAAETAGVPAPEKFRPDRGEPEETPQEETEEAVEPENGLPGEAAALAEVDIGAMQAVNGDVLGWIMIPGTEVSYPLLQGEDNEYYLRRTWLGEYSTAGCIFLECRNDPSLEGFHTIVYGHRMRDGSMFAPLQYYADPDFWQEHPSVYVAADAGVYRYDVFAAREAGVRSIVYRLDLEESEMEEEFIRSCLEESVIDTGIVPEAGDRILTLSTCTGDGYGERWVVHAVLAEKYELTEAG